MNAEPGKIALITGAGSGIGRATARKLFQHGYRVVLAGRRKAPLDALVDEAQQLGHEAFAVPTDVADAASVAALFDAIRQRYGRLDLLFNDAGRGAPPVDVDELSLDDWCWCSQLAGADEMWGRGVNFGKSQAT
jgi:NAD(P)-dependent dehydrogenase (short-subunit alcohol dehydrogenase family)